MIFCTDSTHYVKAALRMLSFQNMSEKKTIAESGIKCLLAKFHKAMRYYTQNPAKRLE